MKTIEVDDDLYQFIASQTQKIGESASEILRRLLLVPPKIEATSSNIVEPDVLIESQKSAFKVETISFQYLQKQNSIGRFLYILSEIQQQFPETFSRVLEIKGPSRTYFATSKSALLEGNGKNPKQIPKTDYWVTGNTNTNKKCSILKEVCNLFNIAEKDTAYLINLLEINNK